ncbi:putative acetyltransferase, GNAT [Longispora fulva]|uniref:Ribosomal protein S18 acetylase RimI-like enzyme n=1 Tax=Longispora fulva TaxID=619741 RepID=A0A8J7GSY2_9ACTN|nr:GNAT family N-acetyltransferase [Longispora fulva]MBG6138044.1 ribosomal protein S18 acetylase RimI-like enzyme [Longispora fulva]GIG60297.1 putative acetyltransferase, GNAT [Longispora fulva]
MTDLSWRPATLDDAEAVAALRTTIHHRTGAGWPVDVDGVRHEWNTMVPVGETLLAVEGDTLLAWGYAWARHGRHFLGGGVHPDRWGEGLGRHLLAWQLGQVPAGDMADTRVDSRDQRTIRLLSRLGLAPLREYLELSRPTSLSVAPTTVEGLRIETFRPEFGHGLWAAHHDAFAEHYGFTPTPEAEWLPARTGHPDFRPEWSFLAFDGDTVVGYAVAFGPKAVHIGVLGTRGPWRGRGVAGALLENAARAGAVAGVDEVNLDVDSENGTGAVAVYLRNGFTERSRTISYGRTA